MFSLRLKTVWLQSIGLQKRMGIEETNELPLSDWNSSYSARVCGWASAECSKGDSSNPFGHARRTSPVLVNIVIVTEDMASWEAQSWGN